MVVQHREREVVLVKAAEDGIAPEIIQRVMHPAHVPFERKAETAEIRRARDKRPGSGFFGYRDHAWTFRVHEMVEVFQEIDGFEVLVAAVLVREPFAGLARVIEVKHRGDGIHAQSVDVKAVAPEERVSREEITNFVAAKIENERTPICVGSFAGVFVLVEGGAVEARESPIIPWEMGGHPVYKDADACFVERIDEKLKLIRGAVAATRRIKTSDLITPGRIIRVLGDGEKLDVGESHFADVVDERTGHLAIAERLGVGLFAPRADVHFVDAERRAERIVLGTLAE